MTLLIESAVSGVLFMNGQFCGPMEPEGQAFPMGKKAEVYVQLFPFGETAPLTVVLQMRDGKIERLEPQEHAFALVWPDGIVQLELRMHAQQTQQTQQEPEAARGALLRYLILRLSGDAQAQRLWLRPQDERNAPDLSAYQTAVPLRFAPLSAPDVFDDRAGLLRRIAPNIAVIDAVMAVTSPAGQGRRLLERIEIIPT